MSHSDQHISEHIRSHGERFHNSIREERSDGEIDLEKIAEEDVDDSEEGPYICAECGKPFNTKEDTEQHMRCEHSDPTLPSSSAVVFLKPVDCKKCKNYENEKEINTKEKDNIENEYERLFIRHEKLKDLNEHQKELNKERLALFKENAELREAAINSQDVAQDLLKQNQILTEDLQVKNQIIEADEKLKQIAIEVQNQNQETQETTEWMSPEVITHNSVVHKCTICPWSTTNRKMLKGHMTMHKIKCQQCNTSFNSKHELIVHTVRTHNILAEQHPCTMCDKVFVQGDSLLQHHISKHQMSVNLTNNNQQNNETIFKCINCKKTFQTETDYKSHIKTHRESSSLENNYFIPVGHPQWAEEKNNEYNCKECATVFVSKADLNKHIPKCLDYNCSHCGHRFHTRIELNEHKTRCYGEYLNEGFQKQIQVCRYFLQNRCLRGMQCKFDHPMLVNTHQKPLMCKRGPGCLYLARGNCNYFHQGVGVQSPRSPVNRVQMDPQQDTNHNRQQQKLQKPCHFQERCWNSNCIFSHEDFSMDNSFLENY